MIVLVGKSCSGKDTVARELETMGYKRIVTYTTRPMRKGEVDGITYHYVNETQFFDMIENKGFAEWTGYNTGHGHWLYGSKLSDYTKSHALIILTPGGLAKIRKKFPDLPITAIYLEVKNSILKKRASKRNDDVKEAKRRYKADKKDFRFVKYSNKYAIDYVIKNDDKTAFETALLCKEFDEMKEINRKRQK